MPTYTIKQIGPRFYVYCDNRKIGWSTDRKVAERWIYTKTGRYTQLRLF